MNARLAELLNRTIDSGESRESIQIFADALLEANEPYGEFIVLSLRGDHDEAGEISQQHEREWLGSLSPFLDSVMYHRGLPREAWVREDAPKDSRSVAAALKHPMLGALRGLRREGPANPYVERADLGVYLKLVCAPEAARLAEIDGNDPKILKALIDGTAPKVTRLQEVRLNRRTRELLEDPALDRIEHFEINVSRDLEEALQFVESSPAFARKRRSLTVSHRSFFAQEMITAWPRLNLTALGFDAHELRRTGSGTVLTLDSMSVLGGYGGDVNPDPYWASLLSECVPELSKVVFTGPQPNAGSLAMAREILPGVRFEMSDGSEAVGRVARGAPPPPNHIGQPPSDPDGVTARILRGDIEGAIEQYVRHYCVGEDMASRKVKDLQKLLRPASTYF